MLTVGMLCDVQTALCNLHQFVLVGYHVNRSNDCNQTTSKPLTAAPAITHTTPLLTRIRVRVPYLLSVDPLIELAKSEAVLLAELKTLAAISCAD